MSRVSGRTAGVAANPSRRTLVCVNDDAIRTSTGLTVPPHALQWEFARGSGPGGQHVNTTASRATLVVDLSALQGPPELVVRVVEQLGSCLRVSASASRSQWQNRRAARARAMERLEEASRLETRRTPTRPTAAARRRRLDEKRRRAELKASRRFDRD